MGIVVLDESDVGFSHPEALLLEAQVVVAAEARRVKSGNDCRGLSIVLVAATD